MAILTVGSVQLVGYNGPTIALANATWKNNVSAIYKANALNNGFRSFKPASGFNSLTTLEDGGHYQFSVVTEFELEGINSLHESGVPDGVVIMDGEILSMI